MIPSQAINILVRDCHQNSIDHGFWSSQNIGEKLTLVNTELSEFFEKYRKDKMNEPDEHCPEFKNSTVEIADAIIRLFDLAGWLEMKDLGEAIQAKMLYNQSRPYMHNKKC